MLIQGLSNTLQNSPLLAVSTLFGAGVLTSLTPCIYPMIPITAAVIAGTSTDQQSRARTVMLTLTYALGLALFYALLGLLAGLTGSLFGTVASNPWVRFVMGNVLLLFGLAMLDVFPIRAPGRILNWAAGLRGGKFPAVFMLGATSGLVAAPCGAPAFARHDGPFDYCWVVLRRTGAAAPLRCLADLDETAGCSHHDRHGRILLHTDGVGVVMQNLRLQGLTLGLLLLALPSAARAQDVGLDLNTKPAAITLADLDGKPVDLGLYMGKKPVLIEFWATWCSLCKELAPVISRAHAKYGKAVEFVTVAVGVNQTPRAVKKHLESHAIPGHVLWDGNGKAVREFMAPGTSYILVLDAKGRVVYTGSGGDQKLEPVLAKLVATPAAK
jgi:thiol:disulfide interchange protein